jgi:hypothetical protein
LDEYEREELLDMLEGQVVSAALLFAFAWIKTDRAAEAARTRGAPPPKWGREESRTSGRAAFGHFAQCCHDTNSLDYICKMPTWDLFWNEDAGVASGFLNYDEADASYAWDMISDRLLCTTPDETADEMYARCDKIRSDVPDSVAISEWAARACSGEPEDFLISERIAAALAQGWATMDPGTESTRGKRRPALTATLSTAECSESAGDMAKAVFAAVAASEKKRRVERPCVLSGDTRQTLRHVISSGWEAEDFAAAAEAYIPTEADKMEGSLFAVVAQEGRALAVAHVLASGKVPKEQKRVLYVKLVCSRSRCAFTFAFAQTPSRSRSRKKN